MDQSTEPIIVVIGHPIAGNPSQFAVERALHSVDLDWRVLSFDVRPEDVGAALEGFSVTGIKGVLIDDGLAAAAAHWYSSSRDTSSVTVNCLIRNDQGEFVHEDQLALWIVDQLKRPPKRSIWFGDTRDQVIRGGLGMPLHASTLPPDSESVESADLIAITNVDLGPVELEADDWPKNEGNTLVIDRTKGHPEIAKIRELGYVVLTKQDCLVGMLQRCLQKWTGVTPNLEVIQDAIEEYQGV